MKTAVFIVMSLAIPLALAISEHPPSNELVGQVLSDLEMMHNLIQTLYLQGPGTKEEKLEKGKKLFEGLRGIGQTKEHEYIISRLKAIRHGNFCKGSAVPYIST